MANAKRIEVEIPVVTTWYKSEDRIELSLTPQEAVTLATILQHVGGCPFDSRRAHADSVRSALSSADIRGYCCGDEGDPVNRVNGSPYFYFIDEPKETING